MQSFKNILHPNKHSAAAGPEVSTRHPNSAHPQTATGARPVDGQVKLRDAAEAANNFPGTNAGRVVPGEVSGEAANNFPGTNPGSKR